jgi:hypothetical protein
MFSRITLWLLCALCALLLGSCSGGSTAGLAEERDTLASSKGGSPVRTFEGRIDSFVGNDLRVLPDLQFVVNSDTAFIHPDGTAADRDRFDPTDTVRVTARKSGRQQIALSVTLLTNNAYDQEWNARISSITAGQLWIGQYDFIITADTDFFLVDGTPTDQSSFDDGDLSKLAAHFDWEDRTLLTLTMIDDNDTDPHFSFFSGMVYDVMPTQIQMTDMSLFDIIAETEWFLLDGSRGEQSDFGTDDFIDIYARLDGSNWSAIEVRMVGDN